MGLAVTTLLCAHVADADTGAWAEGGVRIGYLTGAYDLTGEDTRLSGQAFVLGAAVGVSPSKLWAIGVGGNLGLANLGHEPTRGGTIDAASSLSAGLEGAIRPQGAGLLFRASVEYERMSFLSSQSFNTTGSGDEPPFIEPVSGPRFGLAVGWTGSLVGATVGATYSHLSSENSTFRPIVIGVGLVFHHWGST